MRIAVFILGLTFLSATHAAEVFQDGRVNFVYQLQHRVG